MQASKKQDAFPVLSVYFLSCFSGIFSISGFAVSQRFMSLQAPSQVIISIGSMLLRWLINHFIILYLLRNPLPLQSRYRWTQLALESKRHHHWPTKKPPFGKQISITHSMCSQQQVQQVKIRIVSHSFLWSSHSLSQDNAGKVVPVALCGQRALKLCWWNILEFAIWMLQGCYLVVLWS